MKKFYIETLADIMQDDRLQYETFRQNIRTVPDAFDESVTGSLKLSQLTEIVNDLDTDAYDGKTFDSSEIEMIADTYDELGLISSDRKPVSRDKLYTAPDYHGRGHTTSWNTIVSDLEDATVIVEKKASWIEKQSEDDRGLEDFM